MSDHITTKEFKKRGAIIAQRMQKLGMELDRAIIPRQMDLYKSALLESVGLCDSMKELIKDHYNSLK